MGCVPIIGVGKIPVSGSPKGGPVHGIPPLVARP